MNDKEKVITSKKCICKKTECKYHGKCKECIEKHKNDGNKPHCMR